MPEDDSHLLPNHILLRRERFEGRLVLSRGDCPPLLEAAVEAFDPLADDARLKTNLTSVIKYEKYPVKGGQSRRRVVLGGGGERLLRGLQGSS